MSTEFDFDCPAFAYDLSASVFTAETILRHEGWFRESHELHESTPNTGLPAKSKVGDKENVTNPNVNSEAAAAVPLNAFSAKIARVPTIESSVVAPVPAAGGPKGGPKVPVTSKRPVSLSSVTKKDSSGGSAGAPKARVPGQGSGPVGPRAAKGTTAVSGGSTMSGGRPVVSRSSTTIPSSAPAPAPAKTSKRPREGGTGVAGRPGPGPSSSAVSSFGSVARPAVATGASRNCDDDLMAMLRTHNKQACPAHTYEPARHSVRDVRKWERASGRTWAELKPDERERANREIDERKTKG